jgi:UDP-N-acetylmuramoylalanine--D-glutamate ligase
MGKICNELEYSTPFFSSKMIGVTGTNGKSTLCKLLFDYLQSSGYECVLAGNYGSPLCSFLPTKREVDFVILELSSFQLCSLHRPFLDLAILTSFEPDHLDWHGDLKSYREAKARIFSLLQPGGSAIMPSNWESSVENAARFSYGEESCGYTLVDRGFIHPGGEVNLPSVDDSLLPSFLLGFMAMQKLGLEPNPILEFSFQGLEHRLEEVEEVLGVLCVNDSKATTPGATLFALDRVKRDKIVLIMGGKEKGAELSPLFDGLESRRAKIHKIFAYGEFVRHVPTLQTRGFEVEARNGFEDTLEQLKREPDKGDCILLSPGFSSLDQLPSYEERGRRFKEFVQHL